jgi:hypothetical protein
MLGPNDRVELCRSVNEAALYNAGARVARGDLLVFTEAHVLAQPGAVAAVQKHFTTCADSAACLATVHHTRSLLAQVDARLWELEAPAVQALGMWRHVSLRGFAIRARVFHTFGRFEEDYGRFAETALAVRLDAAGCRIGFIADAVIGHIDPETPAQLFAPMRAGAKGECAWWEREPALARRYFGPNPPWMGELALSRKMAWHVGCDVVRLLCRDRGRPGWRSQLRASLRWLPRLALSAVLGWRGRVLAARLRAALAGFRLLRCLGLLRRLPAGERTEPVRLYLALRRAYARCGIVEFLAGCSRRQPSGPGFSIGELGEERLIGFFPPEQWRGETYRWSGPVGVILLPLPARDHRIRIDIRPTGQWKVRHPRLFFNGHTIPPERVFEADGRVTFDLPAWTFVPGSCQRLTLTCEPFIPARHGLPDPRVLGVAVVSLEVEQLAEAATPRAPLPPRAA